jgi:hypothetical protein
MVPAGITIDVTTGAIILCLPLGRHSGFTLAKHLKNTTSLAHSFSVKNNKEA